MDGGADVSETSCTPFRIEPDAAPVRLIVRRSKPTPGSQLALFAKYSYHAFITDRDGEPLELEADSTQPCRDQECHPRSQVRRWSQPSPLDPQPDTAPSLSTGPGKATSVASWPDCALCRSLPDRPVVSDPHQTTKRLSP